MSTTVTAPDWVRRHVLCHSGSKYPNLHGLHAGKRRTAGSSVACRARGSDLADRFLTHRDCPAACRESADGAARWVAVMPPASAYKRRVDRLAVYAPLYICQAADLSPATDFAWRVSASRLNLSNATYRATCHLNIGCVAFGSMPHVPPALKSHVGPKLALLLIWTVVEPLATDTGVPEPTPATVEHAQDFRHRASFSSLVRFCASEVAWPADCRFHESLRTPVFDSCLQRFANWARWPMEAPEFERSDRSDGQRKR